MKKLVLLICCLLLLAGCNKTIEYDQPVGTVSDMSGYLGLQSEQFFDCSFQDVLKMVEDKKTTIIYFGYDSCPWCNALVPVLNEVSIEKEMKVYYVDFHNPVNFDDVDGLMAIKDLVKDFLTEDELGEVSFYFPTVIYLQKGVAIDMHVATVSGHDATQSSLTEKQRARLKYVLEKEFDGIFRK